MSKRVFIEVTDLRAISSDPMQWLVMKRNKTKDKETGNPTGGYTEWVSYKYLSSFGAAASSLEEELIRSCGAQTFTELHRAAAKIHEQLKETFTLAESYKK